jgi:hypothetical protein
MAVGIRLELEPLRSLGFASIGTAYIGVSTPIDNPARLLLIQNFTDAVLMFSFNGIDDHFPVQKQAALVLDISANKTVSSGFFIEQGSRLYVKEIDTPSSGSVYFSVFYSAEG